MPAIALISSALLPGTDLLGAAEGPIVTHSGLAARAVLNWRPIAIVPFQYAAWRIGYQCPMPPFGRLPNLGSDHDQVRVRETTCLTDR